MAKPCYEALLKERDKLREENERLLLKIGEDCSKLDQALFHLETDMKRFRGVFDDAEHTVYRLKHLR